MRPRPTWVFVSSDTRRLTACRSGTSTFYERILARFRSGSCSFTRTPCGTAQSFIPYVQTPFWTGGSSPCHCPIAVARD
jgi:hypothetical protein